MDVIEFYLVVSWVKRRQAIAYEPLCVVKSNRISAISLHKTKRGAIAFLESVLAVAIELIKQSCDRSLILPRLRLELLKLRDSLRAIKDEVRFRSHKD
ncbi:MAG: hypothetical protein LH702_06995 [Phormidesmis sp. CAN_BIN44]|nr:hypothetical protein [Phormidesmis sp. CAN_BIN44]